MRWRSAIRGVAVVLAAVLAAASVHAEDEEGSPLETWFARMLGRSESQLTVTYFWSKGAKMRAETVVAGQLIVTIVNGDTYYPYSPAGGGGLAVERAPQAIAADAKSGRPSASDQRAPGPAGLAPAPAGFFDRPVSRWRNWMAPSVPSRVASSRYSERL